MPAGYGVLRGRPDRWVREDDDSSPHLQVRLLDAAGQPWRIAINVQSSTGSEVVYWVVDPLVGHPVQPGLAVLPSGFSAVAPSASAALDVVRAPLFHWEDGRALPPSEAGPADDLQDLLARYLAECREAGGEVFAFGVRFDRNLHKPIDAEFGNTDGLHGVHDIHLNQGNKGAHAGDNGVFSDGGLVLRYDGRDAALVLGFQTQWVPTDSTGDALPQSHSIAELIAQPHPTPDPDPTPDPTPEPTPTPEPSPPADLVYLERALLNPDGADVGHEVVVLGSLATAALQLQGWTLTDRNGRCTTIDGLTLGAGASAALELDGSGVQLGNHGGTLVLANASGARVDAVSYTEADASQRHRFVRLAR
jgi:uncharacterized protein YukJ